MASGDQGDHRRRQAEIHRDVDRHQRSATDPRAGRRPAPANGPGQAPAPVRPPRPDPSSADLEQAQQSGEQQNAERGEGAESPPPSSAEQNGARGSLGPFEFHSEKWEAAYVKRIDATSTTRMYSLDHPTTRAVVRKHQKSCPAHRLAHQPVEDRQH